MGKLRRIASALGLCSFIATAIPAGAEPREIRLKPASNWLVDWADNNCTLSRKFGAKDTPFLLTMRAYGRGYLADILIAGPDVAGLQRSEDLTAAYGAVPPRKILPQYATAIGYGPAIIFPDPSLTKEDAAKNSGITLRNPTATWGGVDAPITIANASQSLVLEASGLKPALVALGKCADDLVKQWGLDPEIQASLSRYANPQNRTWLVRIQNSFPSELLARGSDARVNVRVIVGANGRPEKCATAQGFDNIKFQEPICRIVLESARFSPALDAAGQPVRSFYTTSIIYRQ